ncbi:C-GCAxxG-C-C family protein [Candidatus Hodarchaeum mangrovi]
MNRNHNAKKLFENGFNCTQSVFSSFLPPELETMGYRIGEIFGGGINHLGNVCGAITGALMVIGYYHGRKTAKDDKNKQLAGSLAEQFLEQFRELHGDIFCRTLLGYDISTPEKLNKARKEDAFQHCSSYVTSAVEILEDLLK